MKKFKKMSIFLWMMVLFLFTSCGVKNDGSNMDPGVSGGNEVVVESNQKIVYSVSYSLVCEDVNNTIKKMNPQVLEVGGYIANSQQTDADYGWYTYKIPTEKLNQFLDFVDEIGGNNSKTISTENVTSTYNELAAKIETLEASRAAYLVLLSKAESTNEIIMIQKQIDELDLEIKRAYMDMDSLKDRLDYSTVTITYHKEGNQAKEFWNNYGAFIVTIGSTLVAIILYSLPFAAMGLLIFGIVMLVKKNKNKKEE